MTYVHLIQHKTNGYVHTVFDNLPAARLWIRWFDASSSTPGIYTIITREVYNHPDEM